MFALAFRISAFSLITALIIAAGARMIGAQAGQPVLMWEHEINDSLTMTLWDGERIWRYPNDVITNLRWDTSGRWAWINRLERSRVYVWDGQRIHSVSIPDTVNRSLVWSRDGRLAWEVSVNGNHHIYLWDGEQTIMVSDPSSSAAEPAWSIDGRLAWTQTEVGASDGDIVVWDGIALTNITHSEQGEHVPQWSADGQLAWSSSSPNDRVSVFRWNGTEPIEMNSGTAMYAYAPTWSLTNALAWYAYPETGKSDIYVWDGERTTIVSEIQTTNINPHWSPQGWLAWTVNNVAAQRYSAVMLWDGTRERIIHEVSDGYLYNIAWSP